MIKTFGLSESEQWDNCVKSFSEWDVYYLSGYVKADTVPKSVSEIKNIAS